MYLIRILVKWLGRLVMHNWIRMQQYQNEQSHTYENMHTNVSNYKMLSLTTGRIHIQSKT
jgi:hypothetical protein